MPKHTSLYRQHQNAGAMLVDFNGWAMPLHYGSQIAEHHYVRREVGMFDVSHMTITDFTGERVLEFLSYLLANDISKMTQPGQALYSCLLNEQGRVLDDLIVYWRAAQDYSIVSNAGTREKDRAWFHRFAKNFSVTVTERDDLNILAVQGPKSQEKIINCYPHLAEKIKSLASFQFYQDENNFIAKTGYTGEEGFELILSATGIVELWESLLKMGVYPCGLGARDTLRLEAGMNLYGQDMDETTSPYEAGLGWTVAMQSADRHFIGRQALENQLQQPGQKKLTGLVLMEKGMLRHGQKLYLNQEEIGEITSGSFSPTLNRAIALARFNQIPMENCDVLIRDKKYKAKVVKPPFVRKGQTMIDL